MTYDRKLHRHFEKKETPTMKDSPTKIIEELEAIEAMADTLKERSYRLRVQLSGVSTPGHPSKAVMNRKRNKKAPLQRGYQ